MSTNVKNGRMVPGLLLLLLLTLAGVSTVSAFVVAPRRIHLLPSLPFTTTTNRGLATPTKPTRTAPLLAATKPTKSNRKSGKTTTAYNHRQRSSRTTRLAAATGDGGESFQRALMEARFMYEGKAATVEESWMEEPEDTYSPPVTTTPVMKDETKENDNLTPTTDKAVEVVVAKDDEETLLEEELEEETQGVRAAAKSIAQVAESVKAAALQVESADPSFPKHAAVLLEEKEKGVSPPETKVEVVAVESSTVGEAGDDDPTKEAKKKKKNESASSSSDSTDTDVNSKVKPFFVNEEKEVVAVDEGVTTGKDESDTTSTTTNPDTTAVTQPADENATLRALQGVMSKVSVLSRQLTLMERKLQENRLSWMREKSVLVNKVAILTVLLEKSNKEQQQAKEKEEADIILIKDKNDDTDDDTTTLDDDDNSDIVHMDNVQALERELSISQEEEEELLYEQERLEREVALLQREMIQLRNRYKSEQYRTEELQQLLEEMLDMPQPTQQQSSDGDSVWQQERMELKGMVEDQAQEIENLKHQLRNAVEEQHEYYDDDEEELVLANTGKKGGESTNGTTSVDRRRFRP